MLRRRLAGGRVRARAAPPPGAARRRARRRRAGRRARPRPGGTNSGGPPMRVATTERPAAMPSSSACPSGSIRLGWQSTWLSASEARDLVVRHAADERARASRPSSCARSGAVAGEGERSLAEQRERVGEPHDVLALLERADAEEARRPVGRRRDREPLEVDAARDDLRLAARLGHLRLELAAQVLGDADDRRRAPHDEPRRRGDARQLADVAHVAAVRGDDERRARRRARRSARSARGSARRRRRAARRAASGARARGSGASRPRACRAPRARPRARARASARSTCATNVPRSGASGPGIHLRDEEDPHARSVCCAAVVAGSSK